MPEVVENRQALLWSLARHIVERMGAKINGLRRFAKVRV